MALSEITSGRPSASADNHVISFPSASWRAGVSPRLRSALERFGGSGAVVFFGLDLFKSLGQRCLFRGPRCDLRRLVQGKQEDGAATANQERQAAGNRFMARLTFGLRGSLARTLSADTD